jgi:PAS domain S-box-containing protein
MPKHDLILLALDESPVQHLIQRALHAVSYETALAEDREKLDTLLQESVPALILMGEKFSGTSGIRLSRGILERLPTIPILIYAESDSHVLAKEVLQDGLSGYIYPPLRNDDIVGAVERSIQRARRLGDWLRREVKKTTASLEKRAAVSESELKRYERIFANIQDGVIIIDQKGRIQLLNQVMETAFEPIGEYRGKPILEMIDHPDLHALIERAKMVPMKYHEINFDDGRIYNAQLTPIEGIGSVITMQDISYLKQLERMKNEFVHTVSHDLRSPLTSVLGYTELVERIGTLSPQQIEFLGRIRSSVENITSLVNDLLDLSRLEAGFDTRRENVHIDKVLKSAIDTIEGQFKLNKLELTYNIAQNLPTLRGNPVRIRQLFDNLLSNAVKYSPSGGKIDISLEAEDDQIIFRITDEGPGIPATEQIRIFDKFYRATNIPDKVGGSGLGLAIVKSIVDAHQGRIWVESIKDQGSTFFVVLPAFTSEEPA